MGIYDVDVNTLEGEPATLSEHKGKALLLVNVASRCGLTPQYTGLEALHEQYGPRGFSVLGFPCNQFLAQEPGTEADVKQFCSTRYAVTFPMFAKVDVNGPNAHPLYQYLKEHRPGTLGTGVKSAAGRVAMSCTTPRSDTTCPHTV